MSKLHLKENPTLADIQQYVKEMAKERAFTDQTAVQTCLLLTEEVGELCKVIRKTHAAMGIDVHKKYELDAGGEIADIIIVLTCIANHLDIDMEQAFRVKEEQNKKRVWQ